MALKKCFYIRHQAAGILTDKVFLVHPTDQQVEEAKAACEKLHGSEHPELGEHWVRVQEGTIEVPEGFDFSKLEDPTPPPADIPLVDEEGNVIEQPDAASLPRFVVRGSGTVSPPAGK